MIVKELIAIQKQRGFTDSQFAESLGIHRVSWYRNKRTGVIGSDILLRAVKVYPELKGKILSSVASINSKSDTTPTTYQKPCSPKRADLWQNIVDFIKVWF